MKKGDIIIISAVLALAVAIGVFYFSGKNNATTVEISRNNKVLYSLPLSEDNEIDINTNTIIIKNGSVWVENANCKNQICVNHKPINQKGEIIACLPNKVIVEIK